MSNLLTLYAVRNKDGQYFRAKGFGGSGDTWVDEIGKAKIYPRIGQARSRVTYFANNYPQFGIPELVELHVTEIVSVQETKRVQKSQERKVKKEAEREKQRAEWQRDQARRQISEAERTLAKLGSFA